MYLAEVLTLLTTAMTDTFDADYPVEQFAGLHVSIEYPVDQQNYPGIWVDFEPSGELQIVGIDHREYADLGAEGTRRYTRWKFEGWATFTIATLSSLERARLMDEVIKVIAFGPESPARGEFRATLENNDFIAINADWDQIAQRGFGVSTPTPWGTDEIIYEATLAIEVIGEFTSDGTTFTLVPISAIDIYEYAEGEPDPLPPTPPATDAEEGWQ